MIAPVALTWRTVDNLECTAMSDELTSTREGVYGDATPCWLCVIPHHAQRSETNTDYTMLYRIDGAMMARISRDYLAYFAW